MELTASFVNLLESFRGVFTVPTFPVFVLLMSGWALSMRHRYVTDLIVSSDSVGNGHFSNYHRFFSHAAWDIDRVWKLLAELLVSLFVGPDATILLAADDTLCRKRGLSLFGAGMHHDPLISSRAMKLVSWGHDWVIVCLVVVNPWWAPTKVFSLPICARLYRNRQGLTKGQKEKPQQSRAASGEPQPRGKTCRNRRREGKGGKRTTRRGSRPAPRKDGENADGRQHRTRPELLREMLALVAAWFPERRFLLVVDSLYSGESVLRHLPQNVDLIGPVHPQAALYDPPQPAAGRGRKPKKGARLPGLEAWAADAGPWQALTVDQYGLHAALEVKTRRGLYYKAGKDRLLQFVLVRDTCGRRPTRIFYCTQLEATVENVLAWYACRWSIEETHRNAKQLLGLDDPANRTPLAVQRTAPMALVLYSLIVAWFAQHGHRHLQFPKRTWYPKKREPSFADMLTTLRRVTWEEQFAGVRPKSTLARKTLRLLTYLATLAG